MHQVKVVKTMHVPVAQVWALLDDVKSIHHFYPLLSSSPLQAGSSNSGVGTLRTCHFHDGNWLNERITRADKEQRLTVDVYDGSMPLKYCEVNFLLRKINSEQTELTITADYQLKYGLLGKLMNALIVQRKFTGNLTLMAAGIESYLINGQSLPKGWTPSVA